VRKVLAHRDRGLPRSNQSKNQTKTQIATTTNQNPYLIFTDVPYKVVQRISDDASTIYHTRSFYLYRYNYNYDSSYSYSYNTSTGIVTGTAPGARTGTGAETGTGTLIMDISSSKATHQIAESGFSLAFYLQIKMMGLDREVGIAGSADVDLRLLRHLHVSGFVAGVREGAVMRPDGQWTPWSCPRYLIPEFVRAERGAGAGHGARRVLSFPSPSVILEVGLGEESRYRLAFEARTWLEAFVPSQAQEEGLLDLSSIVRPVQVVVTIIIYSDTPKVVVQKWERMSPQNQNQNQSQSQRVTRSSSRAVVSKTDEVVITRSSSDNTTTVSGGNFIIPFEKIFLRQKNLSANPKEQDVTLTEEDLREVAEKSVWWYQNRM